MSAPRENRPGNLASYVRYEFAVASSEGKHVKSTRGRNENWPRTDLITTRREREEERFELDTAGGRVYERGYTLSQVAKTRSWNERRGKGDGLLVRPFLFFCPEAVASRGTRVRGWDEAVSFTTK